MVIDLTLENSSGVCEEQVECLDQMLCCGRRMSHIKILLFEPAIVIISLG